MTWRMHLWFPIYNDLSPLHAAQRIPTVIIVDPSAGPARHTDADRHPRLSPTKKAMNGPPHNGCTMVLTGQRQPVLLSSVKLRANTVSLHVRLIVLLTHGI